MGRELRLEDPNQRQNAGEQVTCISGNCCDPATWPATWDMNCIRCIFCPDDAAIMNHLRSNVEVWLYDDIYYDDPYFDGTVWTTRRFPGGGETYFAENGKHVIRLLRPVDCPTGAESLYHETWHTHQPDSMSITEMEYEAYYETEVWMIRKGLPGSFGLSSTDEFGNLRADREKVKAFVQETYPAVTDAAGWTISGYTENPPMTKEYNEATGETRSRPSRLGDSLYGPIQYVGETPLAAEEFYCN